MNFDPLEATRGNYIMLVTRERRLLQDLARLREIGEDALVLVDRRTKKGYDHKEPVELTIERWRVLSEDIIRLEDRLNSIAHVTQRVIEQLARYEHRGRDRHTFDELFAAIERLAPMKEKMANVKHFGSEPPVRPVSVDTCRHKGGRLWSFVNRAPVHRKVFDDY
ncbi:MAG: hypothetical protein JOZ19_17335 [Rubrobacter sp.]|nr:hypothetical protein [Rubrobacter sp.]